MFSTDSEEHLKYLRLLAEQYPSVEALSTEISRLSAQLSLPKGTEHFMSDIHGEYEAFVHIMNNCSGVIREKVHLWLGDQLTGAEADAFCTLIYYPDAILKQHRQNETATPAWYRTQIEHLVTLIKLLSSKYSREKVRSLMPEGWRFLIDELMHFQNDEPSDPTEQELNLRRYHDAIIDSIIDNGSAPSFIKALAALVKDLAVARLHVVGDIFDRGHRADSILDILMAHHSVDIEWGNHDILWMGAASGSEVCIAAVLRNCLSYGNLSILERGYAIPLRPLALMAERCYPELPSEKGMAWAATVMMFKLEGQLIRRNPEFGMQDHYFLHLIDREHQTVEMDGETWPVDISRLQTVDPDDPYTLTPEEESVLNGLRKAFLHSIRLHEHISFLYNRGWLYRTFNGNLLLHGCVPLNEDGTFLRKTLGGKERSGKALMDYADQMARRAFYKGDREALDFMWYLWCGTDSPLFGRKITTFARAFVPDRRAWEEPRNPYYTLYNDEEICKKILAEFGLTSDESRIINGHTPIRVTHGESPLKAGGKLIVIDGGFCKAYQKTTGIAGYTLISNSHGMRLMSHQPFTSLQDAQENGQDIHSQSFEFAVFPKRKYVSDTDHGKRLAERRQDLIDLLAACREGLINLQ
ncbi:MAG: fructose-1,6-bisphosphatase, partial [Lachnospiraceae bacterium]|nr:fructose-1,6-bisphosphatase [Lachnospiraceae bacterium]